MASPGAVVHSARPLGSLVRTKAPKPLRSGVCLFCSLAPATRSRPGPKRRFPSSRRLQTTDATPIEARRELEHILTQLEKLPDSIMDHWRLRLALQGLQQQPGSETVRVAIMQLRDLQGQTDTARDVLRALLADPLSDEQPWERQLAEHNTMEPLILRVGAEDATSAQPALTPPNPLHELRVSSPSYNAAGLEILLVVNPEAAGFDDLSVPPREASLLSPAIEVPAGGQSVSIVGTPVHKTIVVSDGFMGAVDLAALALAESKDLIATVANMKSAGSALPAQEGNRLAFIDATSARKAIELFRQGPQHAVEFEKLWFASKMPSLVDWLKAAVKTSDGTTKPALRQLVASILRNAQTAVQAEEAAKMSSNLTPVVESPAAQHMKPALAEWAQSAHVELRDELGQAFNGQRWRKLKWWKLFWRVDDVAMLSNEMLSRRFLPTAEQDLVYLAGRIAGSTAEPAVYPQPKPSFISATAAENQPIISSSQGVAAQRTALPKWPGHIFFTRRYLQNETVPALQALAQKLVVQSVGTASMATSIAALLYVSSVASTVFEAGAIAALGLVYGLGRMQKKWEAAREFWHGEVEEEGRKAIRAAEASFAEALEGASREGGSQEANGRLEELAKARELLVQAEDALERIK